MGEVCTEDRAVLRREGLILSRRGTKGFAEGSNESGFWRIPRSFPGDQEEPGLILFLQYQGETCPRTPWPRSKDMQFCKGPFGAEEAPYSLRADTEQRAQIGAKGRWAYTIPLSSPAASVTMPGAKGNPDCAGQQRLAQSWWGSSWGDWKPGF